MSVAIPPIGPERVRYAERLHADALDLYGYIFPPWRWPEWWRRYRAIRSRIRALEAANEQTRASRGGVSPSGKEVRSS